MFLGEFFGSNLKIYKLLSIFYLLTSVIKILVQW